MKPFLFIATLFATFTPISVAESMSLDSALIVDTSRKAFSLPLRNLSENDRRAFAVGNSFFNDNWVTAPSSTAGRDGLGPLFNARSCSACHFQDGRGRPPLTPDERLVSMLFRVSVPGEGPHGGPNPDPAYGDQLQTGAIAGIAPEGDVRIAYAEREVMYSDGAVASLRVPRYTLTDPAYGEFPEGLMVSPRVAPAMIGMGLLAAIPEPDILALADPDDADKDGVSGRPNHVWNARVSAKSLGRFGWKANQPTVEQQVAGAFLGDIGITSPLFAQENCTGAQADCAAAPHGGEPEVDARKLERVTYYSSVLAPPARRDRSNPAVRRGEALFTEIGCAACHVVEMRTGAYPSVPAVENQAIHPYTDLLLHDMGEGLADGRPDYEADGREWRTAPLWGIGLVETVNGHTLFLHDGRARNLEEAILWHGGEGEPSRTKFMNLTADDRAAVIGFLESL